MYYEIIINILYIFSPFLRSIDIFNLSVCVRCFYFPFSSFLLPFFVGYLIPNTIS